MEENRKIAKKIISVMTALLGLCFGVFTALAKVSVRRAEKNEELKKDRYDNAGERILDSEPTVYERYIKRFLDIFLSFGGMLVLAPIYLALSLAIVIDDPGPIFFAQKRIGVNRTFFMLHKFRSMKMDTPHDVPTHLLDNPEQYITRVGKFMRKYSLDELPQIWDIFVGNISVCGPRPALWNQYDLVAERDKYGANDVKPGLTGWAQINGRDELEIPVKARYDGEYTAQLRKSSISGFAADLKCFFGTILSVVSHEGVVEGGTGELHRQEDIKDEFVMKCKPDPCDSSTRIDHSVCRKVLITGAGSYIGTSFENWAKKNYSQNFEIDTVDMVDDMWREKSFSGYDVVFHVAGIAHADVGSVSDEVKKKYYSVNTDLAVETAKKAKADGAKQFVFMSSMIIYGDSAGYGEKKVITWDTIPHPANFYGDSKRQADKAIRMLADENFVVSVLRPPMIYGKGSKGNYSTLEKLACKLPFFPDVENERSMLYIDNLCEFLCQLMLLGKGGIFFPQNPGYTKTSDMVKMIAQENGHKIIVSKIFSPFVWVGSRLPKIGMFGKVRELVNKAFGNSCYDLSMSQYNDIKYQIVGLSESIRLINN